MLECTHQVPPIFPASQSIQQQRRGKCVRPWGGLRFAAAQYSKWSSD